MLVSWPARRPERPWLLAAGIILCLATGSASAATAPPTGLAGLPPRAYVVGTYDGTTLRLFVNGQQVAETKAAGQPDKNKNAVEIGSYAGRALWNGTIDEVAIYGQALPPAMVLRHYRVGLGEVKRDYSKMVTSTTPASSAITGSTRRADGEPTAGGTTRPASTSPAPV